MKPAPTRVWLRLPASCAAGVVLTVAVAWGLAPVWMTPPSEQGAAAERPHTGRWGVMVPDYWPRATYIADESRMPGRRRRVRIAEASNGEGFGVILLDTGWPWLAMRAAALQEIDRPPFQFTFKHRIEVPDRLVRPSLRADQLAGCVPTLPLWPGFAFDTAFYGTLVFMMWSAPGFVRRRARLRRGGCLRCGYDVKGSRAGVCPECGSSRR
jgi:hypothetical protein